MNPPALLPKAEALAEAKAWLRELPREKAVEIAATLSKGVARSKGQALLPLEVAPAAEKDRPFNHPYYWAAFVLIGHAD